MTKKMIFSLMEPIKSVFRSGLITSDSVFIQDAILSLSRERKRAGSPDDPLHGWLLQGTNA